MRPGRVRPGRDHPEPGAAGSRHPASMRPGRVRPGRGHRPGNTPRVGTVASMRPGRVRPGRVPFCPSPSSRGGNRFNEAGARTPRKSRIIHSAIYARLHPRFNEAGARTPRKRALIGGLVGRRAGIPASMRPGRVRPGRVEITQSEGNPARRLKCFNETGARTPRKSSLGPLAGGRRSCSRWLQ